MDLCSVRTDDGNGPSNIHNIRNNDMVCTNGADAYNNVSCVNRAGWHRQEAREMRTAILY